MSRISGVIRGEHHRADGDGGHQAGDGHGHRQAVDACDLVADALGEQDVDGPADGGAEGEQHADGVDPACPRFGEQHDAGGGEAGPDESVAALTVRHRDAERAKELQRTGRAERDPGDRRHEQHRDGRRDDAEHYAHRGSWTA